MYPELLEDAYRLLLGWWAMADQQVSRTLTQSPAMTSEQ